MAKLFYKTLPAEPKKEETPLAWGKVVRKALIAIFGVIVILVLVMQGKDFYDKVSASWDEIKFAYEKPALVRTVREDYENKQEKLEQSFLQTEKSSEEKLVDEVVKRLEAADDLK